ncbi:hypothetical protein [Enterococcus faecalis]|uniref:hypothetical protein n=1 Tax=Enterococcus faecalis TaxID=1351 RepID=UPI0012AEB6F7|nr:hypothetical protein [Enterococcus faecalis]EHB6470533.1 hypothetical protein [Enterococcus faecalis]
MGYEQIVNELKKLVRIYREEEAREKLEINKKKLGGAYKGIKAMIDSEVRSRDSR